MISKPREEIELWKIEQFNTCFKRREGKRKICMIEKA
jgi:hypothetical protein